MTQPLRIRRVRVRITASGWLYIALTIVIGAAAVNTTNNLLYLIASGLLALMAVSGIVAYRALRRLDLEIRLPEEVYAGHEFPAMVTVSNGKRWLPAFLVRVVRNDHETLLVEIPPRGSANGWLPLTFSQRGLHDLGEVLILSAFPFGFFHRGGVVPLADSVLVYPAPIFLASEPSDPREAREIGSGAARDGVGGDYRGERPYIPGDSLSRINWKTWMKLGQLSIKQFEEEGGPPLRLSLDSVPGPSLEERVSQLTGLVLRAHQQGRPVGLDLPNDSIPPGIGPTHRERQLRALALFQAA
jgi:uncharacterized protein (DUF58 family)